MMASRRGRSNASWLFGLVLVLVCACGTVTSARDWQFNNDEEVRLRKISLDGQIHRGQPLRPRKQQSDRPNIVIIMTDDQDVLLGEFTP